MRPSFCVVSVAPARVKDVVERIHHRLRRPSSGSHEIDILRVARRGQMKLVEGRAAAKRERVMKDVVRKDRNQRAADDQILLDLRILRATAPAPSIRECDRVESQIDLHFRVHKQLPCVLAARRARGAPGRSRTDSCTCARTYC